MHTYTDGQLRTNHARIADGDVVTIVGQPWTIRHLDTGWAIMQGYKPHRYIHSKATVLAMIDAIEDYALAMADKAAADTAMRRI